MSRSRNLLGQFCDTLKFESLPPLGYLSQKIFQIWGIPKLHWIIVNSGSQEYTSESESEVPQSSLTLCDPMDCSLTVSSVRGIFQARILE